MEPSAVFAIYRRAFSSTCTPSASVTSRSLSAMVSMDIRLKSYLWHRERMVIGSLCTSVVARMNMTYEGGSSRVFSSALNAPVESICTSSMI